MALKILPAEVWFHIFKFLPLKELKEVMLVCKGFYSICEREILWENVILSRQKLSRPHNDKELVLMKMGRFKFKRKIDIKDYIDDSSEMEESQKQTITRNLLTYCCANDHVEELSLQSTNFSNIGMTLLENCIMKLKKIDFRHSSINQNELTTILHMIPNSEAMQSINLSYVSFSNISPIIIEEAVKSLEKFSVNHSHLSEEQCVYLSRGLKSNSRLKYLDLGAQQNIGLLPGESLKSLISQNLKRLVLSEVIFSPSQLEIILQEVARVPSLVELDMKQNNFSRVDKCLVVGTLSKMEDLMLIESEFGPGQLEALFKHILYKQKTKSINFYGTNLKDVDKTIFAETLRSIEEVALSYTGLTYEQIVSLLKVMKQESVLKNLTMNNDLVKKVEIKLVCDAISSLEHLTLMVTDMERKMVTEIISAGE